MSADPLRQRFEFPRQALAVVASAALASCSVLDVRPHFPRSDWWSATSRRPLTPMRRPPPIRARSPHPVAAAVVSALAADRVAGGRSCCRRILCFAGAVHSTGAFYRGAIAEEPAGCARALYAKLVD